MTSMNPATSHAPQHSTGNEAAPVSHEIHYVAAEVYKLDKTVDRLDKNINRIWTEEKHRRNTFWKWFIGILVVLDILSAIAVGLGLNTVKEEFHMVIRELPSTSQQSDSNTSGSYLDSLS